MTTTTVPGTDREVLDGLDFDAAPPCEGPDCTAKAVWVMKYHRRYLIFMVQLTLMRTKCCLTPGEFTEITRL